MPVKSIKKAFVIVMVGLALSMLVVTGGARTQSAAIKWQALNSTQTLAASDKTAEQVYKNIQVLNELPASELDGVMLFISAALGVGCTHCHTNPWESDTKSTKRAARKMILMTRNLNKESFSGNPAITCYTCHRGQHNTEPQPSIDIAVNPAPDVTMPEKSGALPSTAEIIERYIGAVGGDAAIAKLKTRVSRGSETTTNRMTPPRKLPIEVLQMAPDKLLIIRNNSGGITEGFDGAKGWTKDERVQREITGKELAATKREADFFRYLRIRESYPQMRVLAKEKIGDREVYVVGATSREDDRERLYFDVQNGLLVRRYVAFKTAFGSIPEVTDFEDYREVSGVKLPFTISWSRPPFGFVRKFTEIKLNTVLDSGKFQSDK